MVQFATSQPHRSNTPQVVVENPLRPGRYRFRLVVIDNAQNESEPFELAVTVVEQTAPVLRPDIVRATETIRRPVPITPLRPVRPT